MVHYCSSQCCIHVNNCLNKALTVKYIVPHKYFFVLLGLTFVPLRVHSCSSQRCIQAKNYISRTFTKKYLVPHKCFLVPLRLIFVPRRAVFVPRRVDSRSSRVDACSPECASRLAPLHFLQIRVDNGSSWG